MIVWLAQSATATSQPRLWIIITVTPAHTHWPTQCDLVPLSYIGAIVPSDLEISLFMNNPRRILTSIPLFPRNRHLILELDNKWSSSKRGMGGREARNFGKLSPIGVWFGATLFEMFHGATPANSVASAFLTCRDVMRNDVCLSPRVPCLLYACWMSLEVNMFQAGVSLALCVRPNHLLSFGLSWKCIER